MLCTSEDTVIDRPPVYGFSYILYVSLTALQRHILYLIFSTASYYDKCKKSHSVIVNLTFEKYFAGSG